MDNLINFVYPRFKDLEDMSNKALEMAITALESQNRLTEMLNKQIIAYAQQNKNRHLSDLEYGRKTAYEHCLEVLKDDE